MDDIAVLVGRARDHDTGAWDEIVARFRGLVTAIARSYGMQAADCSDVAQTTWLRLFESIDRLREPERLAGWISTTARRECLRVLKASTRERPTEDLAVERASHAYPAPEHELVSAEERTVLWSAVGALPERHRELMTKLLAAPRPSYADVSAALDMPVGSIGPTRMRVIEQLRRLPEVAALAN